MDHANTIALQSLADLTKAARAIAWQEVDLSGATFLGRLGQLDGLVGGLAVNPDVAASQQAQLIRERREFLESIVAAGDGWHYRPMPAPPPPSRIEVARNTLELAQREGVRLAAFADGSLEAMPGQHGMSKNLRLLLIENQAELVAQLRAGILRIEPPAVNADATAA